MIVNAPPKQKVKFVPIDTRLNRHWLLVVLPKHEHFNQLNIGSGLNSVVLARNIRICSHSDEKILKRTHRRTPKTTTG